MRRFRRRNLGLLFLVVAFFGVGVLLLIDDGTIQSPLTATAIPTNPPPNAGASDLFPDVITDEIAAVQLRDPNSRQSLTLERVEGTWQAVEFPNRTVNQEVARLIARTVADMPFRRTFAMPQDTELAQYGFLDDGAHSFSVLFTTIYDEGFFIAIGNPLTALNTPTANPSFYALVDDRDEMYVIPQAPIFYLIEQLLNPPLAP